MNRSRFYRSAVHGLFRRELCAAIIDSDNRNWDMDPRKIPEACEEFRAPGVPLGLSREMELADNAARFVFPSDKRFASGWHIYDSNEDWIERLLHVITVPFDHTYIVVAYAVDCSDHKIFKTELHREESNRLKSMFFGKQSGATISMQMRHRGVRMDMKPGDPDERNRVARQVYRAVKTTGFPEISAVIFIDHEIMGIMSHYTRGSMLRNPWWPLPKFQC